jgi:TPR repeat protein
MMDKGQGMPKDHELTLYWCTKAANLGHDGAQYRLARKLKRCGGPAPNSFQATVWYTRAAEQGMQTAQFNLGVKFYNGIVTPKDNVMAYFW